MKKLKDYKPQEFGANKDDINSLIMEQASESAEARMMAMYKQPIEYFVEPDIEEGEKNIKTHQLATKRSLSLSTTHSMTKNMIASP